VRKNVIHGGQLFDVGCTAKTFALLEFALERAKVAIYQFASHCVRVGKARVAHSRGGVSDTGDIWQLGDTVLVGEFFDESVDVWDQRQHDLLAVFFKQLKQRLLQFFNIFLGLGKQEGFVETACRDGTHFF